MSLTDKGRVRRDALLDATIRVLEQGGPAAVSHRSVAAEAGVPLSAATYYFSSLDDLYRSALTRATDAQLPLIRSLGHPARLRELAAALHDWAIVDHASAVAQYELMFLAMRDGAVSDDAARWYDALEAALATRGLAGDELARAAYAIDGLLMRMVWRREPATIDGVETRLRRILG